MSLSTAWLVTADERDVRDCDYVIVVELGGNFAGDFLDHRQRRCDHLSHTRHRRQHHDFATPRQ